MDAVELLKSTRPHHRETTKPDQHGGRRGELPSRTPRRQPFNTAAHSANTQSSLYASATNIRQ